MLSRLGMAYRPLPAGPLTPVEGLQLRGRPIEARYALCLGCDDPYAMVDDAFLPLEVVYAPGGGWRPATGARPRGRGGRGLGRAAPGRPARGPGVQPDRPATTGRSGAARAGSSTCGAAPSSAVDGSFDLRPFGIATFRSARLTVAPGDQALALRRAGRRGRGGPRPAAPSAPPQAPVERHGLGTGAVQDPELDPAQVLHPPGPEGQELELLVASPGEPSPSTAAWNSSVTMTAPGAAMFTTRLARLTTGP